MGRKLIYLDDAIDALEKDEEYNKDIPVRADGVRDAIITICNLPSAQPERKPIIRCWCPKCGFEMIPTIDSEMKGEAE